MVKWIRTRMLVVNHGKWLLSLTTTPRGRFWSSYKRISCHCSPCASCERYEKNHIGFNKLALPELEPDDSLLFWEKIFLPTAGQCFSSSAANVSRARPPNWKTTDSLPCTTRVDHPGMTHGILSKTGMGYMGTRDDLERAQGCTHGVY